jgi:inorganic pyrophosphatase
MLIALLLSMLLGKGESELFDRSDLREVRRAVPDETRRDQVLASMRDVNALYADYLERSREHFERLEEVTANVDAEAADYQSVIDEVWRRREAAADEYVEALFTMRSGMTRAEWERVFGD